MQLISLIAFFGVHFVQICRECFGAKSHPKHSLKWLHVFYILIPYQQQEGLELTKIIPFWLRPKHIKRLYLGRQELWWVICDYNDIGFPLELRVVVVLRMPSVEYAKMSILG